MAFRGTFDYTLDAKNRLTVPAPFRPELAGGTILARSLDPCLSLWTPDAFEAYVDSFLADMHPLDKRTGRLARYFESGSYDIPLDSAGRVMIPSKLLEHAGLKKDVVVAGVGDRLEIWDRDAWAAYEDELDIGELTAPFGQTSS
jgi:MraZ protein